MKFLPDLPAAAIPGINLAALRRYAQGELHPSSTATGLVHFHIDEATGKGELHVPDELMPFFTQSHQNSMQGTPVLKDPAVDPITGQ